MSTSTKKRPHPPGRPKNGIAPLKRECLEAIHAAMQHGHMHVLEEWRLSQVGRRLLIDTMCPGTTSPTDDEDYQCLVIANGLRMTTNLEVVKWAVRRFDEVKWEKAKFYLFGDMWGANAGSTGCPGDIMQRMVVEGAADCIAFLVSHYEMQWGHYSGHHQHDIFVRLMRTALLNNKPAIADFYLTLPGAPDTPCTLYEHREDWDWHGLFGTWEFIVHHNAMESARWAFKKCTFDDETRRSLLDRVATEKRSVFERHITEELFKIVAGEGVLDASFVAQCVLKFVEANRMSAENMRAWIKQSYGVDMDHNKKTGRLTLSIVSFV